MPEPDALPTTDGGPARPWIALVGVPGHDLDALERALCTFGLSSLEAPRLRAVSSKALGALGRSWWDAPVSAAGAGSDGPPATLDQELEAFVAPARKAFLEAAGNARDRSRPAPAALLLADQVTASLLPLLLRGWERRLAWSSSSPTRSRRPGTWCAPVALSNLAPWPHGSGTSVRR